MRFACTRIKRSALTHWNVRDTTPMETRSRVLNKIGIAIGTVLVLTTVSAQFCGAQGPPRDRVVQAVDNSQTTVITGSLHPLARQAYDRGRVESAMPLRRVTLAFKRSPEQEAALAALLAGQQDRSSPNYHRWLSPDEFG